MLVRLRVADIQGRLLLVRYGKAGYRAPRVTWRPHQTLHNLVRAQLKELFLDWHGVIVNFNVTAADVLRKDLIATVTLVERTRMFLPDMVTCCGGMVLAMPEEVEAGFVWLGGREFTITDHLMLLPLPAADAA